MAARQVRLLTRTDVERLLDMRACIEAVERAFRMRGEGKAIPSEILGIRSAGGGFHIKAALMRGHDGGNGYFAAKLNANFPDNPAVRALPTIQGLLLLLDATSGEPLAVMDSAALTILRTAAATAVAARHLSRENSTTVAVVGCGAQALAQLMAVTLVRPIASARAFDSSAARAQAFARTASESLGIPVSAAADMQNATRTADIVLTCTTSECAFLDIDDVRPGTFIGAVGADSEHKHEIEPSLMKKAAVVTDSTDQCSTIGDLHHAIAAGTMTIADVRAELGEVIAGTKPGRRNESEIVIFDSTGVAFQDVVSAALVYEAANRDNTGQSIAFST